MTDSDNLVGKTDYKMEINTSLENANDVNKVKGKCTVISKRQRVNIIEGTKMT